MKKEKRPPQMQISVRVNGELRQWTIAPGDLLLDVLRREGYVGVKRGCETGECGACTVLLDGKAVDSCMIFAAQVDGRELLTIEGLAKPALDPVQQSLVAHGAVQCGFCTPGMALSAKALLGRTPAPTEEEVRQNLAGNLCRCTGYLKPVEAITHAAHDPHQAMASGTHAVVGHRVTKVDAVKLAADGPLLLTTFISQEC